MRKGSHSYLQVDLPGPGAKDAKREPIFSIIALINTPKHKRVTLSGESPTKKPSTHHYCSIEAWKDSGGI